MTKKETHTEKSLESVLADIAKGRRAPCYLICGDEDFLVEEAARKILDALLPPEDRDLNLFIYGEESTGVDAICEALLTPPLIDAPKVVFLRKTRLLYSKKTMPDLAGKLGEKIESDPDAAARIFLSLLDLAGLSLEQLRDDGWKRISRAQWDEVLGEAAENREAWLPRLIQHCIGLGRESAGGSRGGTERLEELLSTGLPEGHGLVMTADAVDRRKKLFKIVDEKGVVLSFSKSRGEARQRGTMMEHLREQVAGKGKTLSADAWLLLGKKTGFRLRETAEAIETLAAYTGERKAIEPADIDAVIGRTRDDRIFELTEALSDRDVKRALSSLTDLVTLGTHHLVILNMIIREIRFLFHGRIYLASGKIGGFRPDMDFGQFQRSVYPGVKQIDAGPGKTGLASQHPFVVFNALKNSPRFSGRELIGILEKLLAADIAMKSTGQDARLLLERLVIDICTGATA